jgi:predicted kinase
MKVTILSGVPGSGKSTYSTSNPGLIVSADDYFTDRYTGEYKFDATKLGAAHGACLRAFVTHVAVSSAGMDIFVDNTNTTAVEIAPYYAVALAYGYQVEILTVLVKPEDLPRCAERNKHGVPLKSIERMAENIYRRKLQPFWNARMIDATF